MHFVYRHRRVERIACAPVGHPLAIAPLVVERPGARCGERRRLRIPRERIGLIDFVAPLGADDAKFVRAAVRNAGDECFPNTGTLSARLERVYAHVPMIEVTDDGDARGVGCPDAEASVIGSKMTA